MANGRRLQRSRSNRWIAGVCGGLGEYFGVSVGAVRVLFVIFAWTGAAEIAYLVLWLVMRKEPR